MSLEGVSALEAFLMLRRGALPSQGLPASSGRKRDRVCSDHEDRETGSKKHGRCMYAKLPQRYK